MYKINNKEFPCNTSLTMKFIGGKWKAVILIHLFDKKRYSELRKEIPMVTERTLSLQLKELEEDGLITRSVFSTKPPLKVEYELTALGKTLIPLLNEISNWGKFIAEKHLKIKIEPCITNVKS
ncbi:MULTISPECIES: helix-turn-helix domain-containing protein [Flavobacterium]|uniref:Transcriptional regulator n=2 Tax=Flavobacterium TaxID=237 RepID=A0A2N9PBC9_9FLAO|nr:MULTISPECIES: helix-turn-helix domain-containing protein [Flavobacterium]QYS89257.1 helix-turn-helix transcriptional regulator [Flavobacterium davisii]RVU90441.1 transcriptional regulator [Flavobacterium columnare]SPE77637.1 putative HTH-type transcriptional regulator YybR [Flavobacterium columnare]